jgi:FAD/FMN-containing dehydrogenase
LQQGAGDSAEAAGLLPDDDDEAKGEGVAGLRPRHQRASLRNRTQAAVQGRAQKWAFGKLQTLIWKQICLPLTAVLWAISLLLAWVETHAATRAQKPKDAATHERDVARVVAAIKNRPEGAKITLKPTRVSHMLRFRDLNRSVGPASSLRAAMSSSSSSSSSSCSAQKPPRLHPIDLSKLTRLLSMDSASGSCVVEAGMTFRDLVRATMAHRLMPAVVPPFPEQTVGGAFVGGAIGSTSGSAGSFAATVVQVEMILGSSGELVTAARQGPRADLFHALAGSYHTLGTVVSLTLELVPAPRYVHLSFDVVTSLDKATAQVQNIMDKRVSENVFALEALAFSPSSITIIAARGVDVIDTRKHKVLSFARWWDQTFAAYVRHWTTLVQSRSIGSMPVKHCLPLQDYLFRYDKSSFWLADFVLHLLPWPLRGNTFLSRLAVGWALNDANLRATFADDKEMHIKLGQLRVVQDAHIPLAHAARFIRWQFEAIGVAPLWLCPVLANPSNILDAALQHPSGGSSSSSSSTTSAPASRALLYLNVGLYGRPALGASSVSFAADDVNEELIDQVYKAGGRTLLHGHNWHTDMLMRKMYDTKSYESLRSQYGAEAGGYEHLYRKIILTDEEREAMRQPFQPQPERPLLAALAKKIVMHKLGLA